MEDKKKLMRFPNMRNFGIGAPFRNKLVKCLCHPLRLWVMVIQQHTNYNRGDKLS
jgi:hypothetical protein